VVQPQGQVVSSPSASTSSALLLEDQSGHPHGNPLPPFQHPFAASFPGPHPVESIPTHPHTHQSHYQPTVPVDIGLLFQGVSVINVRAAIANEKARLVGNIIMRYNGTMRGSTASAQEQQQVSRGRGQADLQIARLEAATSRIDQSEVIAAPARKARRIETFPEVSLRHVYIILPL
jgi:hypothetical protein